MILTSIISNLVILVSSTVKFGFSAMAVVSANMGISGTISNIVGGIVGVIVFIQMEEYLRNWLKIKYPNLFAKRFSKRTRFLVRVKQIFGLWGIAFLTPIALSIPVGIFFALDLTSDKKKVTFRMLTACAFWAIVFYAPYYFFHINVVEWVKSIL